MIYRSLDYVAVVFFMATIPQRCTPEPLPPPFNLSYVWIDPFFINLTWQAQPFNRNCSLRYVLRGPNRKVESVPTLSREVLVAGFNSDVRYTVKTTKTHQRGHCQRYGDSTDVSIVIPRQVPLVTDFKFFVYPLCDGQSSQMPFCGRQATWIPANGTSGLQVFYRSCYSKSANLSACPVFNSGGLRQGCHLTGPENEMFKDVCILFRGKVDGRDESHTFQQKPNEHLRTLQPNVSITKQGGHLKVSWRHSIVCPLKSWNYTIYYSECDRPARSVMSAYGAESVLLPFDVACRYEVWVQPQLNVACGVARVDRSALLVYNDGATRDHSMSVAFVAIPGILSVLVLAVCYYVRRKRKTIFKNIPVPPTSLKEMMSSIHQSQQLFVPVREEVEVCRVSPAPLELNTLMWEVP
ncbi:unnamed protein product [Lota lota]